MRLVAGAISARSRRDLGAISARSQAEESNELFIPSLPHRIDYVLGVHKYTRHSSLPHDVGLTVALLPDMVALLALLFHREMIVYRGFANPATTTTAAAATATTAAATGS